jgi:hypothetical protein
MSSPEEMDSPSLLDGLPVYDELMTENVYETLDGLVSRSARFNLRQAARAPCGMLYIECPYCFMQFPSREWVTANFKSHLSDHLAFVIYRAHAVESKVTRAGDHARHPALLGTTLTDSILEKYKLAAEALRRETRGDRVNVFPYVDVTVMDKDVHQFCCAYCYYTTDSLYSYKCHVVAMHVTVCTPLLPPVPGSQDSVAAGGPRGPPLGAEHPGLEVLFARPHVL